MHGTQQDSIRGLQIPSVKVVIDRAARISEGGAVSASVSGHRHYGLRDRGSPSTARAPKPPVVPDAYFRMRAALASGHTVEDVRAVITLVQLSRGPAETIVGLTAINQISMSVEQMETALERVNTSFRVSVGFEELDIASA